MNDPAALHKYLLVIDFAGFTFAWFAFYGHRRFVEMALPGVSLLIFAFLIVGDLGGAIGVRVLDMLADEPIRPLVTRGLLLIANVLVAIWSPMLRILRKKEAQ